ncbi:MAG: hypothetical protein WDO56_05810 [Gammaproteobacteria bacterium]
MATQAETLNTPPRNLWKSTGAVLLGLVVIFALSLGVDQVFHSLGVFPPWGEPMQGNELFALALSYRLIIQLFGSYLTARFVPRNPMRHVWVLAGIGLVLSIAGAIVNAVQSLGPNWYPIALVVTGPPSAWLGGKIFVRRTAV